MLKLSVKITIIVCFMASCEYPAPKQEVPVLPRVEVSNVDYVEEKITPVDTGYYLYKVIFFNGIDTVCIYTNQGEVFMPYAFGLFKFINPDSVVRTSGLNEYAHMDEILLCPFDSCTFYFEMPIFKLDYDSSMYWFSYYNSSCEYDNIKGITSPMLPRE